MADDVDYIPCQSYKSPCRGGFTMLQVRGERVTCHLCGTPHEKVKGVWRVAKVEQKQLTIDDMG